MYCDIVLILLSQLWKLLLPDWVSTHSQETMVYHVRHFCLHIIMFQSCPQLILWKLESLTIIILLCLLYFMMCLLFHIHPSAICNIVLLSALKSLKASYLPFWLRLIHCTLLKIDHFGLKKKKTSPVYLFWLLLHNFLFFLFHLINLPSWFSFPFLASFFFSFLRIVSLFVSPSLFG